MSSSRLWIIARGSILSFLQCLVYILSVGYVGTDEPLPYVMGMYEYYHTDNKDCLG